jgi:hypothetical protein
MRFGCLALALLSLFAGLALADEPVAGALFADQVAPLVKARCVKCHGPAKREGGLSLATPKSMARGGKHGPVIVAGNLEESLIWERIEADEMPPKAPLADAEKAAIRRWIERGAPGLPRSAPDTPEGADHWAFAPLALSHPPAVSQPELLRTPVDAFIQSALETKGLALGPEADRPTLIRRVSFDLTGLPPAPDEVTQFVDDQRPDAYERMVDRFLASPRYGERWGKYWLDAAGYADSNGYFSADTDRPLAYRYRDYVVRSFNLDVAFDRFLQDQLAGDELAGFEARRIATPEQVDRLVATHFLRNAPDGSGESDGNPDEVRADRYAVLEGTTQILGSALLGLTVQCARCHDHKFEPFTQKDYYQLYAVLWPAFDVDHWVKPQERIVEAPLAEEQAAFVAKSNDIDRQIAAVRANFASWLAAHRERGAVPLDDGSRAGDVLVDNVWASAGDSPEDAWQFALSRQPYLEEAAAERLARDASIAALEGQRGPHPGRIAWLSDLSKTPGETHLLKRGVYRDAGPAVSPGPPAVLADPDNPFVPQSRAKSSHSTGRRLAFAQWLTRAGSRPAALLARVTVNRLWQHHFGTGLVPTPENLGYSGAPPSHPALLEYLSYELVRSAWRAKPLHRLIVTSAMYRQSNRPTPDALRVDPDNRLLSRYPSRRLDAEAIRDAMLSTTGELDGRMGGRYIATQVNATAEVIIDETAEGPHRRSVYLQQRRTQTLSLLDVFDAPSIVTNCTRRTTSTMPLQSLSLLNSEFVVQRAAALARRTAEAARPSPTSRLDLAFRLALGRAPDEAERASALRFLAEQPGQYTGQADANERAWTDLCQMLLASNAFLFLE